MQRVDGYVVELEVGEFEDGVRGDALLAPKLEELLLREPLGTPAGVGRRVPPIALVTVGLAAPADLLVRPRREVESLLKPRPVAAELHHGASSAQAHSSLPPSPRVAPLPLPVVVPRHLELASVIRLNDQQSTLRT